MGYLTKTDFKLARSCPTKLYYARRRYPSTKSENEYLEFLADGGHIVGHMARLLYPDGILVHTKRDLKAALEETRTRLQEENVTLFEAVFESNGKLAIIDVLEKRGADIRLIEVKSKSFDSSEQDVFRTKKGDIRSNWREYLEDVAFQKLVLSEVLGEFHVASYLLLPDRAKTTSIEGLASWFSLREIDGGEGVGKELVVEFTGDEAKLREDHFLTRVNVEEEVQILLPLVRMEANKFLKTLQPSLRKEQNVLGKHCSDCEFRTGEDECGFRECWGELADVSPHVFELYFGGALKQKGKFVVNELISERKVSLFDVPLDVIKGKRGERQSVQIECTRDNREWVKPSFKHLLEGVSYPLYFIDFETSRVAIPYHAGMRPYEQIAFQWSCHKVEEPGAEPEHSEWINLKDAFPSFEFVKTLRESVGDTGSILTWAQHERIVLNDIRRQMHDYDHDDPELAQWIERTCGTEELPGRLLDMNAWTLENYFHPAMKGKTSIKYVLPAIWNENLSLHEITWLKRYVGKDGDRIKNPYEVLEAIEIEGELTAVREGSGAMRAYQEMMYGLERDSTDNKKSWSELLLRYCELDTMAMVIIWTHWRQHFGLSW